MLSRANSSSVQSPQVLSSNNSTTSIFPFNFASSPSKNKLIFNGFQKKEVVRCMVCGGKDCPKCGIDAYKKLEKPPAIEKLHSHWITDYIVAMQRPNNSSLEAGALADMQKKKITAVFNLTEPGEHPYCGPGIIHECGFPYNPELLMKFGIKHFNFSWQDMTVPTTQQMMDIVNIAIHEIEAGGKVAVHCHAGFGRTGITCAAIMIAHEQLEAKNVINYIRKRRPGSIQTAAQEAFVRQFEKEFLYLMEIFPLHEVKAHAIPSVLGSSSGTHTPEMQTSQKNQENKNRTAKEEEHPLAVRGGFEGVVSPRPNFQDNEEGLQHTKSPHTSPRKRSFSSATPRKGSFSNNSPTPRRGSFSNNSATPGVDSFSASSPLPATRRSFSNSAAPPPTRRSFTNNSSTPTRRSFTNASPISTGRRSFLSNNESPEESANMIASGGGAAAVAVLTRRRSSVAPYILHTKTLAQTTKDQQYLLNRADYGTGLYKYTHKVVYIVSQAMSMLAKDHFTIACLAFTGLTKLAIKNTMNSLIGIDDNGAKRSDRTFGIIAGPLVRRTSSFMVATNALSESSEEGMLRDLKKELNHNKWTQLLSLGDIISSSLRFSNDSVSKISKLSRSTSSSYSRSRLRAMDSIKEMSNDSENNTFHNAGMRNTGGMVPLHNVSSISSDVTPTPFALIPSSHSQLTPLPSIPSAFGKEDGISSQAISAEKSGTNGGKHVTVTFSTSAINSPATNATTAPTSYLSPTVTARKTIHSRVNSLRQASDADYAKPKKMAANLLAQLLLDFIETRKDPIFSEELIQSLIELWKRHGDIYEDYHQEVEEDDGGEGYEGGRIKAETIRMNDTFSPTSTNSSTKLANEIMELLIAKLDRYKIELLNAIINIYVSLHDVVKSSDQYQQQYSELLLYSTKIPGFQNALQTLQSMQATLLQNELTNPTSTTTTENAVPVLSAVSNNMSMSQSSNNINNGLKEEVLECMEAFDALVGLRFAVACMHARKINNGILKNRSLTVDLVKLFLLKTSKAEFVIINNITFNEDNYEQIKNEIGIQLLYQLDVVFRTIHLLVDYHWNDLNIYREEERSSAAAAASATAVTSSSEGGGGARGSDHEGEGGIKAAIGNPRRAKIGKGEIVMWNLFDYDEYEDDRHSKIKWNVHSSPSVPTTSFFTKAEFPTEPTAATPNPNSNSDDGGANFR